MGYLHTKGYCSTLKGEGVLTPATPGTSLEDTTLSELSQPQEDKRVIPLTEVSREVRVRDGGCPGLGEGNGELVLDGHRASVLQD